MTTEISELEASTKRTTSPTDTIDLEKPTMTSNEEIKRDRPVDSSDDDDESYHSEEEDDDFDINKIKEPRLSSSTVPIVVQVSNAHKTARFYTNDADPLFQGVCLYSTSSSTKDTTTAKTREESEPQLFRPRRADTTDTPSDTASPESLDLWDQWYFPSVFRYLWQRGSGSSSGWQQSSQRRIQMDSE